MGRTRGGRRESLWNTSYPAARFQHGRLASTAVSAPPLKTPWGFYVTRISAPPPPGGGTSPSLRPSTFPVNRCYPSGVHATGGYSACTLTSPHLVLRPGAAPSLDSSGCHAVSGPASGSGDGLARGLGTVGLGSGQAGHQGGTRPLDLPTRHSRMETPPRPIPTIRGLTPNMVGAMPSIRRVILC